MPGSVRSRIDLEQRERRDLEDKMDYVPRGFTNVQPQCAATISVRQRAELAAFVAEDEGAAQVTRRRVSTTATTAAPDGVSTRVRDRQQIAVAQREIDNPVQPASDPTAAEYARLHEQELARAKEKEAEDIRTGRLVILDDSVAATQKRMKDEAQAQATRLRDKLLEITYTSMGADADEITIVDALVREKHPAKFGDGDVHRVMLLRVREAMNGN
jgi:hypothetical protein